MKLKLLVALTLVTLSFSAFAQTKSIYLELLGASGAAGVNYDSRFEGNSGLGYRVGLGYGFSRSSGAFGNYSQDVIGIPAAINYLFGENKSNFELGLGLLNAICFDKQDNAKALGWGYSIFGDIAYRFQPIKGFMFRAGITPSFYIHERVIHGNWFWPQISIGYSF